MRAILASTKYHDDIDIFCPSVSRKDLEYLVQFLYAGNIPCDNEKISCQILDNLNKVFGFPDSMVLALPNNAGICTINVEKNEVPVETLVKEEDDEITIDNHDISENPTEALKISNVETVDHSYSTTTTPDIIIEDHDLDTNEDLNKTSAFPNNELPKFYECQFCFRIVWKWSENYCGL